MSSGLFWRAAGVQAVAVAVVFVLLVAAPLPGDFFEDWGVLAGPVAWCLCSIVTARVLSLPASLALIAAAAGGVAGVIVGLGVDHTLGLVAGIAVFGASCAGYDEGRGSSERAAESPSASASKS